MELAELSDAELNKEYSKILNKMSSFNMSYPIQMSFQAMLDQIKIEQEARKARKEMEAIARTEIISDQIPERYVKDKK